MTDRENNRMKLGITGGIGSGKTSVCRVFNVLGIPVFSADPEAKKIMDSDERIKSEINRIVGKDMYHNGLLDRPGFARIIFNDKVLLDRVNSLVHPVVFELFMKWVNQQNAPYVIMELAILFESGAAKLVDRIATVVAPVEERIDRVVNRNNLTRGQVLERIKNQHDDTYLIERSDYIIENSENDMIIPVILDIHQDMISLVSNR